ncbi:MAG TPA: carbohydrate binding domain-containing protein [bacterium]|nr:carbohydrate binding domain-containing protein [bacterium]HOG37957.1 carbohydrate binding domain-containing protein [bacterium]HQI03016.1 carbohydrate binding domain-containing protein [bacterium]
MKTLMTILVIITMCCGYLFGVDHIFTLPIEGNFIISSGWQYPPSYSYNYNYGIDYSAVEGTRILSAYGGQVIAVQRDIPDGTGTDYGNYVKIDHGNGYKTIYAHMLYHTATVSVGEFVYQGQFIGKVGDTGYSTNPHLHFGVYYNNEPIDPYGWYSNNTQQYNNGCNPDKHYFVSNPPSLPGIVVSQPRILPDDLLVHVTNTPNYYWIRDRQMQRFTSETPFYTWGFDWSDAVEISQEEFNSFSIGPDISPKVGTCVYDENSQRWVFDYQSNNSTTIVKRRVNNWQQLGYSADVWIPTTSSYLSQFAEGSELTSSSDYPYGTVLQNVNNMNERYVIKRGIEVSSSYTGQKILLRLLSDNVYMINYYHSNFNIVVTQNVLNYYQIAPFVSYEKIMDGKLISGPGPACYYIENGLRRLIIDESTFNTYGFNFANVLEVSDSDVNSFQSGENIQYFAGGGMVDYQGGDFEDGGFDSGICNYWILNDSRNSASFDITSGDCVDGNFKAEINIGDSGLFYEEELMQLVEIESGESYNVSFWAKSNPASGIKFCIQNNNDPWNNYGLWKEINLTSTWKKYQYIFIANTTDQLARLNFMIGESAGCKYFDNVVFEKISDMETEGDNLIINPGFETGNFAPFEVGDLNSTASYYIDNSIYHSGNNSIFIDPNQNGLHFEVQLYQNLNIVSGQNYTLSFWAKSTSQRQIQVELYNENSPWNNFGLWQVVSTGTDWQNYTMSFTATSSGIARISWNLGEQDVPVWIDDVSLILAPSQTVNLLKKKFEIFPNPFNSTVSLMFDIEDTKEPSEVQISIYNIKGQLVKKFVPTKSKSATINWDSKDDSGKICSSGVYICRVNVNGFSFDKKLVFSK